MPTVDDVLILSGKRTPIGSFLGGLAKVSATELGAVAAKAALEASGVEPGDVDAVYFGNVLQTSKDAVYLARHVALDAGVPIHVPALTVNRLCGSGLEAIVQGAKSLALGEASLVLAGGSENMSQAPYAMRGVRQGWRMIKSDVDDVLFSALHDPKAGCSIGETVEHLAAELKITRADADAAAVRGQQAAARAIEAGILAEEITPVTTGGRKPKAIERDECPRPESTVDVLATLPGLYGKSGVVSAGNSCGLNDAGAALVMTTRAKADEGGLSALGRVVSWGTVGVEPKLMGLGPVQASRQALDHAGLTLADMDVIELNDSFSVQSVAIERELGLDPERVNPNGGAIALGHPMGATGVRVVLAALHELRRREGRYALCTVCIGGGQGIAMVLERV